MAVRMKLGRRGVRRDARTLQLGKYIAGLAAPPTSCDFTGGLTNFGMLLNDRLGCCTVSGAGHGTQVWSLNANVELTVTDAEVLAAYEAWCGYNPADPSTDNGGVELDVLNLWRKQGFAGAALNAYCAVDVSNQLLLQQAIATFGGLYIGFEVPNYIMDNVPQLWDAPQPGQDTSIDGGHCVFVCGYRHDPTHGLVLKFISWGAVYEMTWGFWAQYGDESYALVNTAYIGPNNPIDMPALEADIANIQLGAVQPGTTVQFTIMVQPKGAKVQGVQVTVVGLPDSAAVLSANGLSITVYVPKGTKVGTLVTVTWVCGLASATAQFTVGGA